jgi:hypothetical protein
MSTDDKIRYGMVALTGASMVLMAMSVHLGPLNTNQVGGFGTQ